MVLCFDSPWRRDVIEFNEFLKTFQVEVTVEETDTQLGFEFMLQNDRLEDFLHKIRAVLGLESCGNVVEERDGIKAVDVVWLEDLCSCHLAWYFVFDGLELDSEFLFWKLEL